MSNGPSRNAFSLIELIAVLVVLAILAGVALPRYLDYASEARTSALQGALGGVRTGLSNFLMSKEVEEGQPRYPTLVELTTPGLVLETELPLEPYASSREVIARNALQAQLRTTGGNGGWCYYVNNAADPPEAVFYSNCAVETTATDETGQIIMANAM